MKRQKGITISGLLIVSIIVVVLMLLAFKVVPVFIEFSAIEKQFKSMSQDPALRTATRVQFNNAWAARAMVDDLRSIPVENIEYTKDGDELLITGEYSVKVSLFRNVAACFDFKPSSK